MSVVVAQGARLFHGFFRAGDDELILDRLNPETRRKICQVRDDGDKRAAGIDLRPAFANLAVEIGDDRNEQVRRLFAPEFFKKIHERPVKYAYRGLKNAKKLSAAKRPAILQQDVVLLLDADAGELAQNVQAVSQVLELNEFELPIGVQLGNYG